MKPTQTGWYKLRSAQPDLVALAGAHYDLWIVEDMLQHCVVTDEVQHEMCEELEEGCWTAAVIRYERAFSGLPAHLNTRVLAELSAQQTESHHFFRYLRDKMFAHRTGIGDDFEVKGAVFPNTSGELALVNVAPRARRISSLGSDLASEFLLVVVAVRGIVKPLFEESKIEVTRSLQRYPLEQIVGGSPIVDHDLTPRKDDPEFRKYLTRALSVQKRAAVPQQPLGA